ncbi:hypothetical protein FOZ60_007454 [Perkinsus olseni]|uniref:Ankyrin Repeat n=1 Tax=Perkinsus olseni TaxID=32597 RepID=A0A7J6PMM6_PEROL|nr:hypothetical protein FOZ60_007454 [Perkinsus olseni]
MLSRPKATPAVIGISSTYYWERQRELRDLLGEGTDYTETVLSRRDHGGLRLRNLWLDDEDEGSGSFDCCCADGKDGGCLSLTLEKTPSTVASSPLTPNRLTARFLLRPTRPILRTRRILRQLLIHPLPSSDPEGTAELPLVGDDSDHRKCVPSETVERLRPSIPDWQGIVLETESVVKDFDGHSALREKAYSSSDDLKSMAHLMGVEPPRPRYGRDRSVTVGDLEEYMESLRSPRRGSAASRISRGRDSPLCGERSKLDDDDDYDDSDSEENILARMEAMGAYSQKRETGDSDLWWTRSYPLAMSNTNFPISQLSSDRACIGGSTSLIQVVVSPSVRRLGRSHSGKYTYLFMYADANLFREVNGTGSVFELWALIRAQCTDPHLRCTATQFSSPPSGLVRLTTREPAYFAISNKKTKFLSGSLLRAKARILQASYYDPCDYQFSRTGTPCDFCVPLRAPSEWMYVCCGALVAVTIALIRRLSLFRATPLILVGIADFLSCGLLVCIGLELHELDLPTSDVHTDRVVVIQPDSSIEGDSESVSTTFSAIYNASKKGAVDKVRKILDAKADPNAQDRTGQRPLLVAAAEGHSDVCRILIERKADVTAVNSLGATALALATNAGHVRALQTLLRSGADVNCRDIWLDTPLIAACRRGHPLPFLALLVDSGADITLRNRYGETAIDVARMAGDVHACKFLSSMVSDDGTTDRDTVPYVPNRDVCSVMKGMMFA